eukprot:GILI01015609.1.p1 GENE.GILI01015609.1~~GILI01015609.1.p1  ORF type:complete len:133 (+),score=17.27 GILI01015609.1:50-448(+)
MPPKAAVPPPKKAEPPKILCGCGVNTYTAPPKGKKKPVPIDHYPECTFQKTSCNRYPHLPKCAACEVGCPYCAGINPWCPHCLDNHCLFQFKRDIMALGIPKRVPAPEPVAAPTAPAAVKSTKRPVASPPAK